MGVTIRRNGICINVSKAFKERLRTLEPKLEAKMMDLKDEIHSRTLSGKDADGRPFREYSSGYKKRRAKKGRGSNVNLTFRGNMLGSMQTRTVRSARGALLGRIYVPDQADPDPKVKATQLDKARWHMEGAGDLPKREFFRLSNSQAKKLIKFIKEHLIHGP